MAEESKIELIFPEEEDAAAMPEDELGSLSEDEEELDVPFSYDEESPNLVAEFEASDEGKDELKKIAEKVKKDFEDARSSSEEYRERIAADYRVFAGELPEKDFPFKDCANAHVPIMLENISRLTMRVQSELFGDYSNVFSVVSASQQDDMVTRILTIHGNWQLNEQIDDFYRHQERGVMAFFTSSETFFHSYYDFTRQENRHEALTPDQLYIPYVHTSTRVDLSDCPYIVKVLYMYRHDMQVMRDQWEHVDDVLDKRTPSWDDDPDSPIAESVNEQSFISVESDSTAPYKLLQYEGWLELPQQSRDRYCQVILDQETGHVLKLSIHEEVDWRDRERYENQMAEYEQYVASRGAYDAQFDAAKAQEDETREGLGLALDVPGEMKGELIAQVSPETTLGPPPPRPAWMTGDDMEPPSELKRVPIHMFSHGVCIEAPNGSRGLSYGRIQADFNRAADTALSQFIDAGTLGNCWTFLATEGFDPKGNTNPIEFAPGKINHITGLMGDDIRKVIMELKPEPANPQLMQLADKMYEYGQSSVQAPSVLSGESGKSGETFRGISARIDQATKQLSVSTRKYARVLNNVIRNNARLNATFLPDNELVQMVDYANGRQVAEMVGRKMYERNYRIRFTSDMKYSSQAQRISEADEVLQMPQAVPQLQQNTAFIYEATKRALIARDRMDMVATLGPPPPPPSTPLGMPPPPPPGAPMPPQEPQQ